MRTGRSRQARAASSKTCRRGVSGPDAEQVDAVRRCTARRTSSSWPSQGMLAVHDRAPAAVLGRDVADHAVGADLVGAQLVGELARPAGAGRSPPGAPGRRCRSAARGSGRARRSGARPGAGPSSRRARSATRRRSRPGAITRAVPASGASRRSALPRDRHQVHGLAVRPDQEAPWPRTTRAPPGPASASSPRTGASSPRRSARGRHVEHPRVDPLRAQRAHLGRGFHPWGGRLHLLRSQGSPARDALQGCSRSACVLYRQSAPES